MASLYKRKRLTVITIVYWFLLTYIITALVFWFLSLVRQSTQMSEYKLLQLKKDAPDYSIKVAEIEKEEKRKVAQYVGEGATFMLLILVGAVFVYRATRRQIQLNTQQQNFMMAITHELKTPIAITRLNIETLLKRKLEESQQEKLLHNALQESNRLNDLCDNILLASQIDAGDYLPDKEVINLSTLVGESAAYFKTRFPYQLIEETIEAGIYVKGDSLLLQLAVNNLIENAIKYSEKQKPVTVALQKSGATVQLQIKDQGKGIAQKEKRKIFEKFYRAGNENTRNTKGTGLGLYLTKKIITDHNGNITVQDNIPSGCIFVISLHTTEDAS
ncbi:ATP-binding protein [Agriterribacter sp.]|uniref:sensor histidine kinase n=1 Tax=Agriterribacter sp. TaxID=2821509 RepID=UPI002CF03548|nr:ATP-binding protein [Agriterribacter sp.]HRO44942.1 ATP-binding protein [Agriterribacter sp.]HRQ15680.1 ATP-binding protein [Agriterribacter sp.]